MLRGYDHVRGTEEGVASCGEDLELSVGIILKALYLEEHRCAFGFSDPVALHELDALRPVHQVQVIQKPLCIGRDLQDPLADVLFLDLSSAAFALAFLDFLVGQSGLAVGAPVDGCLALVGQPLLVELLEDPLSPVVV